jgi:O-methyltransferase
MTTSHKLTLPRSAGPLMPSSVRQALLRLWRRRGLNQIFNAAMSVAPDLIRQPLERERARIRREELEARIRHRVRLVPETSLRDLLAKAIGTLAQRSGAESLGDYLEFGVYNGTSLISMYRELESAGLHHVRLFGFDSFQGFPANAATEDEGRWQPGRCYCPLEFTTAVLEAEGIDWKKVVLVPGWFTDTLNAETVTRLRIRKASVIMIDCDLYSSTKAALTFCAPFIQDEALIMFDEWNPRGLEGKTLGERKAFQEFLEESGCFSATPFGKYGPRTQTFLVSRVRTRTRCGSTFSFGPAGDAAL